MLADANGHKMHPSAVFSRLQAKDITKQALNAADGYQASHHVEHRQTNIAKHGDISINDDPDDSAVISVDPVGE